MLIELTAIKYWSNKNKINKYEYKIYKLLD